MFGRPPLAAVKEDLDSLATTALEKSLRSAVQNAQALVSIDEQLKREIEERKRENQLLKDKLSEKGKECEVLKELASRIREERDGLIAKLKENEVDKKEIIELKRKTCDLECAKLRAQTEVDVYRSRFVELEARVLNLEKQLLEMVNKAEKRAEPVDRFPEKGKFADLPREPAIAGKREASEDFVKSELLSQTNPTPTGRPSHGKRTENHTVVIIDSDDECGSHESASELPKAHPRHNIVENQAGVLKRKPDELDNKVVDVDDNFRNGSKQAKVADNKRYATINGLVPPNLFNDDSSSFSSSDDDVDHSNFVSSLKPESFVYTNPKSRQ